MNESHLVIAVAGALVIGSAGQSRDAASPNTHPPEQRVSRFDKSHRSVIAELLVGGSEAGRTVIS